MAEVEAVPKLVKGPCLLNVVSGGKTPVLDPAHAERLGFKLAILPGILFQTAMAAFDAALAEIKAQHRHPDMKIGLKEKLRRMGAEEWDAPRGRFKAPSAAEAGRTRSAAD